MLVDTHAHIHFSSYGLDAEEVWQSSKQHGVNKLLAVGCRLDDSEGAISFAKAHEGVWASIGIHPHEANEFLSDEANLQKFERLLSQKDDDKIVAIGETGLDYYYQHSDKSSQRNLLEWQLGVAKKHNLPVVFHVRDAFEDFWPIVDNFGGINGVVHSFSSNGGVLDQVLARNLYVGVNGIMTFTKDDDQLEAAKRIPLDRLLLETDAPFLTPKPFRGKVCKPEYVKLVAEFLSQLRGEPLEQIAKRTTMNAQELFGI
jgi:TatD DNase family protein